MFRKGREITFKVDFCIEDDEDRFYAYCPSLKGLFAAGATEIEALENAKEAAVLYLKSLIKHGDPIPLDGDLINTQEKDRPQPKRAVCAPRQRQAAVLAVAY